MDIIIIKGKCNSGKSSSIRYATIKLLEDNKFIVHYNSKRYSSDIDLAERIKSDFYTKTGLVGQITLIGNIDGKVVCITTYGDSFKYDIKPALERARKIGNVVDIFVCAAHGNALVELEKLGKCDSVDKTAIEDENLREECNKQFAEKIANKIYSMVAKNIE